MVHHDTHHFQTYLIFFLISLILIGTLALFFMPPVNTSQIQSSALEKPISDSQSASFLDQSPSKNTTPESSDASSQSWEEGRVTKRMKFTKLLLRYQWELQALEAQKAAAEWAANPDLEDAIQTLTTKIQNLQNMIAGLAQ